MSIQLQDILANPVLLKDISEETLQSWIQQYPYVSLFHLYALKSKNKYSESDLHKTAFNFNNREKLYFLLNDKHIKSTEKNNTIAVPALIEINEKLIEEEIEQIEEIIDDSSIIDRYEQETTIVEKQKTSEEINVKDEISKAIIDNEIIEEINIDEEINLPGAEVEKTIITAVSTEEKQLSIADKIMLEIEQLKVERAKKANETEALIETKNEENIAEKPVIKIIEKKVENTEEPIIIVDEKINEFTKVESVKDIETIEKKQKEIEDIKTTVVEKIQPIEEIIELKVELSNNQHEKILSVQDEVIARINKIKEERLLKISEEKNKTNLSNEEIKSEISDLIAEKNIVEQQEEIKEEKFEPVEKPISIQEEIIARIQKIKEERAKKTNEEKESDVKIEEKTIQSFTEIIKENITTEINQFTQAFPEPLLVSVDTLKLKDEKIVINEEQPKEETIVPIKDILANRANQTEVVKEIIDEKLNEKIAKNKSLISKKSDLFIPSVEENISVKESESKNESTLQERIVPKLDEEAIKEPHTFVEWLKLLDGNLQIQTSETIKETENWIEIPRYEVEQAIANKKEIQQEEQKLFEPNFEEGEVDLFNEIDEEVTKVASDSVVFKQDMMTETLAKIYQKQGKTDKALEIYNTLLIKFPEKSAYFASLIRKIEKEK